MGCWMGVPPPLVLPQQPWQTCRGVQKARSPLGREEAPIGWGRAPAWRVVRANPGSSEFGELGEKQKELSASLPWAFSRADQGWMRKGIPGDLFFIFYFW